jgi:hypothetical protein
MSSSEVWTMSRDPLVRTLAVAASVAAVAIVVNAVMVGAPFLAILAGPFILGVLLHRRAERSAAVVLALMGLLYTGIAVNYIRNTGSDWPIGDYIGVLVGGSAAVVAAATGIVVLFRRGTARLV